MLWRFYILGVHIVYNNYRRMSFVIRFKRKYLMLCIHMYKRTNVENYLSFLLAWHVVFSLSLQRNMNDGLKDLMGIVSNDKFLFKFDLMHE